MFNKRADGGLTAIVIIIIALIFLGWLINLGSRQCSTNADCKSDQYCGSDFSCHSVPVIEKAPVIVQRNYNTGSIIWAIAVTIIFVTLIRNFEKVAKVFKNDYSVKLDENDKVYTNFPVYYEKASK